MIKKLKNNSGIIFVTTLAIMLVLLALGLSFMTISRTEMAISDNQADALEAFYYADSGVQHSIADLRDGGGGSISSFDLDSDSDVDYDVTYAGSTITSVGTEGDARKTIIATVQTGPWTGALQIGGAISLSAPAGGTINGNVDAVGSIHPNIGLYTVNGTVRAGNTSLTIPTPDYTEYANPANFATHFTLADCSSLSGGPADGVYYITGNCVINEGGGPFVLNGTLVVRGTLDIDQVNPLTITPSGSNPAIVAETNVEITSASSVTLNGLVYAEQDINLTTIAFLQRLNNGAYVAGNNFNLTNVSSALWTFDAGLNPPYFTGGGGAPTITEWQGHP